MNAQEQPQVNARPLHAIGSGLNDRPSSQLVLIGYVVPTFVLPLFDVAAFGLIMTIRKLWPPLVEWSGLGNWVWIPVVTWIIGAVLNLQCEVHLNDRRAKEVPIGIRGRALNGLVRHGAFLCGIAIPAGVRLVLMGAYLLWVYEW